VRKRVISAILVLIIALSLAPAALAEPAASTAPPDIRIFVDGRLIPSDAAPFISKGRTLIPISTVAQTLGARVDWNSNTRTVTIKRADKEIVMIIGDEYATVNGERIKLDVAPVISGGRTFLPIRFVVEQFSQLVDWNQADRTIHITEDMSFAYEDSNLKAWFLGCGAILARVNNWDPYYIGMNPRTASNASRARQTLSASWGVSDRDDLIMTMLEMMFGGHAANFAYDAMLVNSLSAAEYNALLEQSGTVDRYMWRLVKNLSAKWGDNGIVAWDWFRVLHLAGWGYLGGYLELREAYIFAEAIAEGLQNSFSSWDQATANYMDGYAYWSRTDISRENTEYHRRLRFYDELKAAQQQNGVLFDPRVWTQPVKGVIDK